MVLHRWSSCVRCQAGRFALIFLLDFFVARKNTGAPPATLTCSFILLRVLEDRARRGHRVAAFCCGASPASLNCLFVHVSGVFEALR